MREKEPKDCNTLKELFELWQAEHIKEVDDLIQKISNSKKEVDWCEREIFIKEHYRKRENTISSQYVQFFNNRNCEKCSRNKGILGGGEKAWEYVLKNAFNMDGCTGTFDVGEGFEYIFLLKEANDSKKTCIEDYPKFELKEERVNMWIQDWVNSNSEDKRKFSMLNKINEALKYLGTKKKEIDFTKTAAYMNVNKRGGTFTTTGYDESAVIHYAKKYKEYIWKEIQLLAKERKNVTVFVCGGKKYFQRLMGALEINEEQRDKVKVEFINIPHPSGRSSISKMIESMKVIQ